LEDELARRGRELERINKEKDRKNVELYKELKQA
jgi:hypothetical protein